MCTGEHTLWSTYFWSSHHLHMHSYMHTHPCNALSTQVYIQRTSCLPLDLPSHTHACAHAHIQTYSSWDGCLSLDLLSHARTHRCARQTTLPAHWLPSNSRQFVELQGRLGTIIVVAEIADSTSLSVCLELCKCPLMRGAQGHGKMRSSGMSVDEGTNVQDYPGWSVLPAVSRKKCI